MSRLKFNLEGAAEGSKARAARFQTLRGEVLSPVFMPVGTQATVKGQTRESLIEAGAQVMLANTYHLLLRPGPEVFKKVGGIHSFMRWNRPVLTDSGGFQIFSLSHSRALSEEGASFKSYVDGKNILLSPELSIETQKAIGSDIMMVLDQCVPSTCEFSLAQDAMARTHRWAARSLRARGDSPQSLFGIVQGACFEELRKQSASYLTQLDFDGFAIGGLAVGESKSLREDFTELSASLLPHHLPRYLMGVGTPIDILEAVHRGVDMFDCILPSSLAQRGVAFTHQGKLQLRRGVYKFSEESLDSHCHCTTCQTYSQAYLHHLVKTEEILGWHLIGIHNFTFYHQLMKQIRESILSGSFKKFYEKNRLVLQQSDPEYPVKSPRPQRNKKFPPKTLGNYEVQSSDRGFSFVRQVSSGEIMHSVNSPEEEADQLYIHQSGLASRIQNTTPAHGLAGEALEEMVIWDVGLGAATNAMSVIRCCEKIAAQSHPQNTRKVHLVSFEIDLDSFKLALAHSHLFTSLRHSAPHQVLNEGLWVSKKIPLRWSLIKGNFRKTFFQAPLPDIIYYDPFSSKTDLELWNIATFRSIFKYCENRTTELFTYSSSTSIRAGLFGAGFYVAKGVGIGPRAETTIALTPAARHAGYELLSSKWLERWNKSDSKYPLGLTFEEQNYFKEQLFLHNQFKERDGREI